LNYRPVYLATVTLGLALYIVSLFSPLLSVSEFYIFRDTLTIYSVLSILINDSEWLLFFIIAIFAIALPSLKYALLLLYGLPSRSRALSGFMRTALEAVSKWAMLDVFIVAVLVAGIKLKSFASAETHYGLYLFVISVLISMICTYLHKHLLIKRE